MKIRPKVVTLLAIAFATLVVLVLSIGEAVLLPRFEQVEADNARTAMTRIEDSIGTVLAMLNVSVTDWGDWADTYRYMGDHNAGFESENLKVLQMKQLHLTVLALSDTQGKLVWSHAFDPVSEAPLQLDLFAGGSLPADFPWRDSLSSGRARSGLIATSHGVVFAAIYPILDGYGNGPSRGIVLMGRMLAAAELAAIGARAHTAVRLTAIRDAGGHFPGIPPPAGAGDRIVTTDEATQVSKTFEDIYGRPLMTLRVDVPREITASARATLRSAMAFTVGGAIAVLLLMLIALDRIVLAPLGRVTRHAIALGLGDDLTKRLNLKRADEIGALAHEFDRMVEQVAESRRQLVDNSFSAGIAEFSRGVLHNIGNAMTPLSVRLAKQRERLLGAPTADVERALEERERAGADAARVADLDEFLRLASRELAEVVRAAEDDAGVITLQTAIVQNALAEQLHSTRAPAVVESVELPAVISQTVEIVPDSCRNQISIELDPSLYSIGTVRTARTVLRLVVQNLIINAAEAVRAAGRGRGVVRFSAAVVHEIGQDKLLLECVDTGVGIAAENLARVFERGYSTKRDSGNFGIGLHWSATAVNALGGRIWATSDGPGHGATLHLVMPLSGATAIPSTAAA